MFGIRPQRVLGLAIGEKAIDIAEVHAARGGSRLMRCARFVFPADAGWDQPQELGQRLDRFLRHEQFTARLALAGLPGRWVLAKPRPLPPVTTTAAAAILRLTVEREYQADAREWAFDFAGASSSAAKTTILLAATPQPRLTQVTTVLEAANLRPRGITSTTLTLALAQMSAGAMLHLSAEGAELTVRTDDRVVAVECLATAPPQAAALAGEVRRILAVARPDASFPPPTLTIWNACGLDSQTLHELNKHIGLSARVNPDLSELGVPNAAGTCHGHAPSHAGAVALAAAGLRRQTLALDFLHSCLATDKRCWLTRPRAAAAGLILILLAAGVYLGADWYIEQHAVDSLQAQLTQMKDALAAARANVDRVNLARGWYDARPPLLDCLRAVTQAFPPSGVWTTSLAAREDLSGTLAGKAQDERGVLELLDRLRTSKQFADVKLLYLRQADRGSRIVSFALTFVYTGRE